MKIIILFSIASFTIIVLTQDKVLAQTPTNLSSSDQTYHFVKKWGSSGIGDGQFERPRGIAIDSSGNVYVADSNNNRIQKFDSNGKFITKWGSEGTGDGQFYGLRGIAIDSQAMCMQETGKMTIFKSLTATANSSPSGVQKVQAMGSLIVHTASPLILLAMCM